MTMAFEVSALRGEPRQDLVAEDDYQSFSEALGSSARGRAFLAEYARRNRHADTAVVLAALDRLEAVARSQKAAPETERIRQDLRALLDTLQSAKPQIDLTPGAIKAATLSALLEFVQARIEALVGAAATPTEAPGAAPSARNFLTPVPQSDEPELPIPRPGASAQPSIALVQPIAPPVDAEPASGPTVDPMVLSLDPRVGPVFGEPTADATRPANVIADINFIDALIVRGKPEVATEDNVALLTLVSAESAEVAEAAMAPPPSLAVLPPLELTANEPAAAQLPQATLEIPDVAAETTARAEALVRATHATADAIDNIVAAAAALMADEAATAATIADTTTAEAAPLEMAVVETATVETATAETIVVETAVVDTTTAETPIAEIAFGDAAPGDIAPVDANLPEIGFVAAGSADFELKQAPAAETAVAATFEPLTFPTEIQAPTVAIVAPEFAVAALAAATPAPPARDDALAAIMAMSEEERLALFT